MTARGHSSWGVPAAFLTLAAIAGLALPAVVDLLRVAGRYIPQPRIEYDYFVGLLWATVVGISIRVWPIPAEDRRALLRIWIVKSIVALVLMLAYEWNYVLDAYDYYARSQLPGFPVAESRFNAGTIAVARLAWLHAQIFPDSYHALKVSFSLVGLVAVYLVYRGTVHIRRLRDVRVLYLLGLFPSILFWSTTLGKEPIHLFGISLYVFGVLAWRGTGRNVYALAVIAGALSAFWIRSWSAPILLFPLAVFVLSAIKRPIAKVLFTVLAVAAFAAAVNHFATMFNIETIRDVQAAAEARSAGWQGGSAQERTEEFTGIGSMLRFAPVGAFTALFRPLPGEVRNPFGMMAGFENVLLLGLVALAIVRMRVAKLRDPVVVWAVLLVATWSFVYSFVSYYNFGAAVRFKLQIMPVLLLLLAHLSEIGTRTLRRGISTERGRLSAAQPVLN